MLQRIKIPLKEKENHLSTTESKWFAIYTKPKCEKLVHTQLERKQIHSYLPIEHCWRYYSKQRRRIQIPLISSYVFVKINSSEYTSVLRTNHVLNFVKIANNLISIPEREINVLKKICGDKDVEINLVSKSVNDGDWVEVTRGRLIGIQGILRGRKNLMVVLETIGFALEIAVPLDSVKKISKPNYLPKRG